MPRTDTPVELLQIAIRRLNALPVCPESVTPAKRLTFLAELAKLGYRVANPGDYTDSILQNHSTVMSTLANMRGGDAKYVPLFQGFPNRVPEQGVYLLKRIFGYLGNVLGTFDSGRRLDNGVIVPEWLFDTDEFGADPITQLQDLDLFQKGVVREANKAADGIVQWTDLRFVDEDLLETQLATYCQQCLYSKSSIKEGVRDDIECLLDHLGASAIDFRQVIFKETRTLLCKYFWNRGDLDQADRLIDTPTDLLRLMASLTETDVSLATPIRFPKLRRAQRRFVMAVLERATNLEEDLVRYHGLWLSLAKSVHAGEFAERFPRAASGIDSLRNGKIETFNSRVERAINERDVAQAVGLLRTRPGMLARRLHHLLEIAEPREQSVLSAFRDTCSDVPLKNLLVMETYFRSIDESPWRAVINKNGRIRVLPNRQGRLRPETTAQVIEALQEAIERSIGRTKDRWTGQRVWVDPRLSNFTVPLQQRKASDGVLTIGRGSRIALVDGHTLRLFVYWKETQRRTDLDLSLIQFDQQMQYTGHVSYTNLESEGIVHSGDLQSAPHGAAEFIDIDIARLRNKKTCRFIASQIYRYSGENFGSMQCHSGWMIRECVDASYKSFDITTVQHKFDLTGTSGYALPIIVDLEQMKIIFVDLYVGNIEALNRVERSADDISLISQQAARMIDTRPNLYDLAHFHVRGREAILCDACNDADIVFGIDEGDFSASDIAGSLSELL